MTTRIQFTTAEQARAAADQAHEQESLEIQPSPEQRVQIGRHGEVMRLSGGQTSFVNGGSTSVQMAHTPDASQGILATAVQQGSGRPVGEITPQSLVTLPSGMQTTVQAALAAGYLRVRSDGSYEEVR